VSSNGNNVNKVIYRVRILPVNMTSMAIYAILALTIVNLLIIILGISFLRRNTEDLIMNLDESLSQALITIVENVKNDIPALSSDVNPIQMAIAQLVSNIANRPPDLTAKVITRASDGKFTKDTSLSTELDSN
jgi:hypothetical protein